MGRLARGNGLFSISDVLPEFEVLLSYLSVAFCTDFLLSLVSEASELLMCYLPVSPSSSLNLTTMTFFTGCCRSVREQLGETMSLNGSVIFCSQTELFTTNKHAMYCTNILYPVAVHDETTLFDTMRENS